jgi:translation initiation factor IF-3
VRINESIRARQVRLIGLDGKQVGVVPIEEAYDLAQQSGLDLVEVAPDGKPPVCKIMDYGKFMYEQGKKEKRARKRQHVIHLKEIQLKPKINDHDYLIKLKRARDFLMKSHKVKVTVQFRGRELAHTETGQRLLDRMAADVGDVGTLEQKSRMEGRRLVAIFAPKAQ